MRLLSHRFWVLRYPIKSVSHSVEFCYLKQTLLSRGTSTKVDPKVLALRDKLLYSDHLDGERTKPVSMVRNRKRKAIQERIENERLAREPAISILVKDTILKGTEASRKEEEQDCTSIEEDGEKPLHLPYARVDSYETTNRVPEDSSSLNEKYKSLYEKYLTAKRHSAKDQSFEEYIEDDLDTALPKGELWKVPATWMTDIEQYDDILLDGAWHKRYGTPDPNSNVSAIPCGGCGALLHCKDAAIPGYLPSELFLNRDKEDLKTMICQRCHFLKFYNAALEVKVSAKDYPKLLSVIKRKKAAIILMVDLTDFPCSIWPDLKSVLHPFTPIFLVGNKIDLLPRDCPAFRDRIAKQLLETVQSVTGIPRANFTGVNLLSAKTGYGVEELINRLHYKWPYNGDVYLVGCTNVGKSSLFNALLNSDYCKVQAIDLVQRATVSSWPGTTLNLLKFPLLNPRGNRLRLRVERLKSERSLRAAELELTDHRFKQSRNIKHATLQGFIGKTFTDLSEEPESDPFVQKSHRFMPRKLGLDESHPDYLQSHWCYDTPGTIQPDQILDLLTTDELLATLPTETISPRTFILRSTETVFVAGMGRLDYVQGEYFVRCTLFTSRNLPIAICRTDEADYVYSQLLETAAFVVPSNNPERLKVWPRLESKELKVTGIDMRKSAADVVLSSIGWIAITAHEHENVTLRAWTPEGRGIYLRSPALLEKSVNFRGVKIVGTPLYTLGRQAYVK